MTANINWWRGDPSLLRYKWLKSQRDLGNVGAMAGGARNLVGFLFRQDQAAKQKRAAAEAQKMSYADAVRRAQGRQVEGPTGSAEAEAQAARQSDTSLPPPIDYGSPKGAYAGPHTGIVNEPEKQKMGVGAEGTPPGVGTGTQDPAEAAGMAPYAADLDPLSRIVRWGGSKLGLMEPAAPGPSSLERGIPYAAREQSFGRRMEELKALAPYLGKTKDPGAAIGTQFPEYAAAARAGGAPAPTAADHRQLAMLMEAARNGDERAKAEVADLLEDMMGSEGHPPDLDLWLLPPSSGVYKQFRPMAREIWEAEGRTRDITEIEIELWKELQKWRDDRKLNRQKVSSERWRDVRTGTVYPSQLEGEMAGANSEDLVREKVSGWAQGVEPGKEYDVDMGGTKPPPPGGGTPPPAGPQPGSTWQPLKGPHGSAFTRPRAR